MLLAIFKPVSALSMESDAMTTAGETFCLMYLQKDELIKSCHSDFGVKKDCCGSCCNINHSSFLLMLTLIPLQPILKNLPFSAILVNLNTIYHPPATPPPIQA